MLWWNRKECYSAQNASGPGKHENTVYGPASQCNAASEPQTATSIPKTVKASFREMSQIET